MSSLGSSGAAWRHTQISMGHQRGRGYPAISPRMIEFAPFRLDTVNQCLWYRADSGEYKRIRLSPTPFAVLRYLAEHPGRLVTTEEILEAVWPKLYVQPEAVKAQIHEIRRILRDDPKSP